jgi:ATP-binding cassette subfamily B protein
MTPQYSGKVIDTLINSNSRDDLIDLIKIVTAVHLGSSLLDLLQEVVESTVSRKVKQQMREDFFDSLLKKDMEFYDNKKTGELISTLNSDISKAQKISTGDLTHMLKQAFQVTASLSVLYTMSPSLTFLILLLIPPKTFLISKRGKYLKSFQKMVSELNAGITSFAVEVLSNIRIVKSFGAENKELNDYKDQLGKHSVLHNELAWRSSTFSLLMSLITRATHALILWHGGSLVLEGKMTPGQLSAFLLYGSTLTNASKIVKFYVEKVATSLGSCERVFAIIDYQPKIRIDKNEGKKINKLKGAIKFDNVHFHYPGKKEVAVLKNVSVDIKSGETVAIVGYSGSGKSTLVSLLERFYDPVKGDILIDGESIKNFDINWLHRKIGYVPQEPALFSGTIEDNITYGVSEYSREQIVEAIAMANANFVFDKSSFPDGIKTLAGERGAKLSGGQKQRIAIARALIKNPRILIFDEATSALDAESEHQVQAAINSLMQKKDRTVLIIAHRLSTIIGCKRILVFDKGKLIEQGSHEELLKKKGYYKTLIDKQLSGYKVNAHE